MFVVKIVVVENGQDTLFVVEQREVRGRAKVLAGRIFHPVFALCGYCRQHVSPPRLGSLAPASPPLASGSSGQRMTGRSICVNNIANKLAQVGTHPKGAEDKSRTSAGRESSMLAWAAV